MESEWCQCPGGGANAYYRILDEPDVWVHSECNRPTFPWWQAFEKYCDECGRSFSSPLSDVCADCGGLTWADALHQYVARMLAIGIDVLV